MIVLLLSLALVVLLKLPVEVIATTTNCSFKVDVPELLIDVQVIAPSDDDVLRYSLNNNYSKEMKNYLNLFL